MALIAQTALTNADPKYWAPRREVVDWLAAGIPESAKVLDVGPGTAPFMRADAFVDWARPDPIPESMFHAVDFGREPLPFADKEFDFVYCRHTLEDLYNPFLLCAELSRVAKAGYVETPSPLSEVCRGIDGGSPPWRGYHHHRYLVWNAAGVLHFLAKYPIIEYLQFDNETAIVSSLKEGPRYWNTHLLWRDRIEVRHLQHDVDYRLVENYGAALAGAMSDSVKSTDRFTAQIEGARSMA